MKRILITLLLGVIYLISYSQSSADFDKLNIRTNFGPPNNDTISTPFKIGELRTRPQDNLWYRYNGKPTGQQRWDYVYFGPLPSINPTLNDVLIRGNTSSQGMNVGPSTFGGLKVPVLGITGQVLMVTVGPDGTFSAQTIPGGGTTIGSINGLTANAQFLTTTFNVATSPKWNSATATHGLNLPIASATFSDTGIVTPAQVATWNGKTNLPGSGTHGQYLAGDTTWVAFPAITAPGNFTTAGGGINITGTWPNLTFTVSSGGITALTGDVTASGSGSIATTISANVVTYAKMQQMVASRLLGNSSGSTANMAPIPLGNGLAFVAGSLVADTLTASATAVMSKYREVVLTALINGKVANLNGTATFLGYGSFATKPSAAGGKGFYYASDSTWLLYSDATNWIQLTDRPNQVFHVYFRRKGQPGDSTLITGVDSTFFVAAIRDSLNFHHVINPDGSWTFWSTGGGSGTSDVTISRTVTTVSVTAGAAPGVIAVADDNNAGVMDTTFARMLHRKLTFNNRPGSGHKMIYSNITGILDSLHFKSQQLLGDAVQDVSDTNTINYKVWTYANVMAAGAKGDGTTDDAPIFNSLMSNPNTIIIVPPGTYKLSSQLNINQSNVQLKGYGRLSKLVSDAPVYNTIFVGYNTSNIVIDGLSLENNNTSTDINHTGTVIRIQLDTASDGVQTRIDSNIKITNNYITGYKGMVIGLAMVSHRGGKGGYIKDVTIEGNEFAYIGESGSGILGESTVQWFKDIRWIHNRFRHMGNISGSNGFGISVSGLGTVLVDNNYFTDFKTIGTEMSGVWNSTLSNNSYDSSYSGTTTPYTFNASGSPTASGNIAINNRVLDSVPYMPYIINQQDFRSQNNRVKSFVFQMKYDSVRNSTMIGDYMNNINTTNPVLWLRHGSSGVRFIGCDIKGINTQNSLILLTDSNLNNTWSTCRFSGYNVEAKLIQIDGLSLNNTIVDCYSEFKKTMNYNYKLNTIGQLTNILALDSNGNKGVLTIVPVGFGGTGRNTFTTGYLKSSGTTSPLNTVATIPGTDISGDIAGNANSINATLAMGHGGTGSISIATGYVKSNGSALSSVSTVPGTDVNGDIAGNAASINNTLPISKGGTSVTTFTAGFVKSPGGTGALTSVTNIVESDQSLTDIVTNNVSTSKHGYAPKLSNDATTYLNGTGTYTALPIIGNGANIVQISGPTVTILQPLYTKINNIITVYGKFTVAAGSGNTVEFGLPHDYNTGVSYDVNASFPLTASDITGAVGSQDVSGLTGSVVVSPNTTGGHSVFVTYPGTAGSTRTVNYTYSYIFR